MDTIKDKGLKWLAEGAVIVVSILLAFAIDAWWDQRGEDQSEGRAIEQFLTELDLLEEIVSAARERTENASQSAEKLLDVIHGGQTVSREELMGLLTALEDRFYLADAMRAYHQLSSAGAVGQISSGQTRAIIANIANYLSVLDRMEDLESDFIEFQLKPFLRQRVDLYPVHRDDPDRPSRFEAPPEELLAQLEFSNLLIQRLEYALRVQQFRSEISKELIKVREAIRSDP